MKFHLPLTPRQVDFYGQIFDVILKYYPLNIKGDNHLYREHPGQIALEDLIAENIVNRKNYRTKWGDFNKLVRLESKKTTEELTSAFRPSFSSNLIIKKFTHDELTHTKKIHYSVSLLGPFYTIYGLDETMIIDDVMHYPSINIVTVSPYKEFETGFNFLKSKIEKRFKGYKFIPFTLQSMGIEGLYDPYNSSDEYTIYRTLFDDYLNEYNPFKWRGDIKYGYDEWIINDGKGPFITLGPPL